MLFELLNFQGCFVCKKTPSPDSLYDLLRPANPLLKYEDLKSDSERQKAFKQLQLRLHPDHHSVEKHSVERRHSAAERENLTAATAARMQSESKRTLIILLLQQQRVNT